MTEIIILLVLGGAAAYYARKYKTTGDRAQLKSCGALVMVAVFIMAFDRGVEAVVFPEKAWQAYTVLLAGALAGTLLMAAGYEGWRKVSAGIQGAVFVAVTALLVSSLNYFRTVIIVAKARGACQKVVPGCAGNNLYGLDKASKESMAAGLMGAMGSADRLTRLGTLYAMAYMPDACLAAVPELADLLGTADDDELQAAAGVLEKMGPAAAAAAPALEARLNGAEGRARSRLEAALKAVTPPAEWARVSPR